jgi:hypothetical protein
VIGIPNDGTIFHYTNGGILFLSLQKHRRLCDLGWMTMDENEEHHDMYIERERVISDICSF